MPIRNRHKIGSHLMVDDESGFVHYREDMRQIWDGTWRHKKNFETRQPQEFVRAKTDPRALKDIRPEAPTAPVCNFSSPFIGETNVPTPIGPFTEFAGIGDMEVSTTTSAVNCPFIVYNNQGRIT